MMSGFLGVARFEIRLLMRRISTWVYFGIFFLLAALMVHLAGGAGGRLELLTQLSLSPGYMSQQISVVLARDLYEKRLPGDEPEPIRVDWVDLYALSELTARENFSEGRALAGLYLVRDLLEQRGELRR